MKLGEIEVVTDEEHAKHLGELLSFLHDWYLKGKSAIHAHTLVDDPDVTFEELVHKCTFGRVRSTVRGEDRRPGGIYADSEGMR